MRLADDFKEALDLGLPPKIADVLANADASPTVAIMALMIVAKGIVTVSPGMPSVVRWAEMIDSLLSGLPEWQVKESPQ